jgi:DNA-binding MarR family transcriptional regulator
MGYHRLLTLPRESKDIVTTQSMGSGDAFSIAPLVAIVGFSLRMAQLKIFDDFTRRMERMQLRPAEYSVLTLIRHNPGCHASQIAEVLSIKRPNFVSLLAMLEDRDLVTRKRSLDDKRMFHLQLTRYGQAFLKKADLLVAEQEEQIEKLLGDFGKPGLIDVLKRLQSLSSEGEADRPA